jgi:hypothetical protein
MGAFLIFYSKLSAYFLKICYYATSELLHGRHITIIEGRKLRVQSWVTSNGMIFLRSFIKIGYIFKKSLVEHIFL